MNDVERQRYIIQRAFRGWGMHAFVIDKLNNVKMSSSGCEKAPPLSIISELKKKCSSMGHPSFIYDKESYYYMGFYAEELLYVLGPLSWKALSENEKKKYLFENRWLNTSITICCISIKQAISALASVSSIATGIWCSEEEILLYEEKLEEHDINSSLEVFQNESKGLEYFTSEAEEWFVKGLEQGIMRISKYALQEKLKIAANLVKNSNESIGCISDYLAFHSQSYFTEQFKKNVV